MPRRLAKRAEALVKEVTENRVEMKQKDKKSSGFFLSARLIGDIQLAKLTILELIDESRSGQDGGGDEDEHLCVLCYERCESRLGTCGHRLCDECAPEYCSSQVADRRLPLTCPVCDVPLLTEDVTAMTASIDALYGAAVNRFVLTQQGAAGSSKSVTPCATPDCPQLLDATFDSETCAVCLFKQCTRCGEAAHSGETCEESKSRIEHEASPSFRIERAAMHIKNALLSPSCPTCHGAFIGECPPVIIILRHSSFSIADSVLQIHFAFYRFRWVLRNRLQSMRQRLLRLLSRQHWFGRPTLTRRVV